MCIALDCEQFLVTSTGTYVNWLYLKYKVDNFDLISTGLVALHIDSGIMIQIGLSHCHMVI